MILCIQNFIPFQISEFFKENLPKNCIIINMPLYLNLNGIQVGWSLYFFVMLKTMLIWWRKQKYFYASSLASSHHHHAWGKNAYNKSLPSNLLNQSNHLITELTDWRNKNCAQQRTCNSWVMQTWQCNAFSLPSLREKKNNASS